MATISFKENLTVSNKAKVKEIVCAMKQPMGKSVRPSSPDKLPSNAGKVWFKRSAN